MQSSLGRMTTLIGFLLLTGVQFANAADTWLVVLSSGSHDLAEVTVVPASPNVVWLRSPDIIPCVMPAAASSPSRSCPTAVILKTSRTADSVAIDIQAGYGELSNTGNPIDGLRRVQVARHDVRLGGRADLAEAQDYGLPPLTLRVLPDTRSCGFTLADVTSVARSIVPEQVTYDNGICGIIVRNISSSSVMAIGTRQGSGGTTASSFPSWTPQDRPLIKPGSRFLIRNAKPLIHLAVFSDHTFEGDPREAAQLIGEAVGTSALARRALTLVIEALRVPGDDVKRSGDLRQAFALLPVEDESALQAALANHEGINPAAFTLGFGQGMRSLRDALLRHIDQFDGLRTRYPHAMSFDAYWQLGQASLKAFTDQ